MRQKRKTLKRMVIVMFVALLIVPAMASANTLTLVDSTNHVYTTGSEANGDLLYWYMDLQQSTNLPYGYRDWAGDTNWQTKYADDLSLVVAGVGTLDTWRTASSDDLQALFGAPTIEQVNVGSSQKPRWVTSVDYPDAPINEIINALSDTGWELISGAGHEDDFWGRYGDTDGSGQTPAVRFEYNGYSSTWDIDPLFPSTPYYTSSADKAAWIVASGSNPVPEPATMLLLGTGLIGLAGGARRRRKK